MKKKNILHIGNIDKFIFPFVKFNEENLQGYNHEYLFYGYDARLDDTLGVVQCKNKGKNRNIRKFLFYIKAIRKIKRADVVILHSTNNKVINWLLYLLPKSNAKKCKWIVWGGDLHNAQLSPEKQKSFPEKIKRKVIPWFSSIATVSEGNYKLAKKNYGATGNFIQCFSYPTNIPPKIKSNDDKSSEYINILVGNSADPINDHEEVFHRLVSSPYYSKNVKVYCPLSYGHKAYRKEITELGFKLFGKDNFYPLTELLPIEEYNQLLLSIDIAIFNHKRPQALGNTVSLLSLGKKVYACSDTTQWNFFNELGVHLGDVLELNLKESIDREKNSKIINEFFSKENLISQLNNLYSS